MMLPGEKMKAPRWIQVTVGNCFSAAAHDRKTHLVLTEDLEDMQQVWHDWHDVSRCFLRRHYMKIHATSRVFFTRFVLTGSFSKPRGPGLLESASCWIT